LAVKKSINQLSWHAKQPAVLKKPIGLNQINSDEKLTYCIISHYAGCCCLYPKASLAVTEAAIPSETSVSNDQAVIEAGHTILPANTPNAIKQNRLKSGPTRRSGPRWLPW
jgi:hypothetical protein